MQIEQKLRSIICSHSIAPAKEKRLSTSTIFEVSTATDKN
jgi:hypothetical protein